MRMTYVSKIQANLKRYQTVHARKATSRILDGSYRSIFKGRSMNFDELREYVPGDDIKDMDWKASARSQKFLVRQYIAEKRHNIMLVFDTNRRMLGLSDGMEEKRELAIMGAGTLAYFVNRNGDYVSATYATKDSINHFPFKNGLGNIEIILEKYHREVTLDNYSDINTSLEYIIKNFKRRMIILIVTDATGINRVNDVNLKRLLVAHDVLFLNISDAPLKNGEIWSMGDGVRGSKRRSPAFLGGIGEDESVPAFFTRSKKLNRLSRINKAKFENQAIEKLKNYGIPCSTIDYLDELDKEIIELLAKHKMEKR